MTDSISIEGNVSEDGVVTRREPNRRGDGEELRAELISAATELLVSPQPVAAPSLRAIARRVGVSPSGVYLHFASQEDLIAAVIESEYQHLRVALMDADRPSAAPLERLAAMARTYVAWGIEHPGAYQLLFESADALPGGSPVIGTGNLLMEVVTSLIRAHEPITPARARRAALRIWISLHGIVSLRIHKPHASWETTAARDADALVQSIVMSEVSGGQ